MEIFLKYKTNAYIYKNIHPSKTFLAEAFETIPSLYSIFKKAILPLGAALSRT